VNSAFGLFDSVPRSLITVLLVAAITCFAGLGQSALSDSDEAYYAEAGREMRESGDFLTPRFNYENRFQKPVLFYWFVAATYTVAGVNAAAARFPAALSALGMAWLAWYVGRRWSDDETALLSGLILATSFGLVEIAHLSLPDVPLAFFISASIFAAIECWLVAPSPRVELAALAGAAAGAAFLTKGPIGIVIPVLVVGALVVIERRWSILRHAPLAVAALMCIAVGVPWYAVMTKVHGVAYLHSFFVGDNLERFATDRFNYPRPVWFYLPIVGAGLLPWSPFMALWAGPALETLKRRQRLSVVHMRLLVWTLLPLLLFTASIGKQPRYILPMLPPLAVGIAMALRRSLDQVARGSRGVTVRVCGVCTGSVLAIFGAIFASLPAAALGLSPTLLTGGGLLAVVAGVAAALVALLRPVRMPYAIVGATIAAVLAFQFGLLSAPNPEVVQQVAARINAAGGNTTKWSTDDVFVRNLVFYVGRKQAGPFDRAALVEFLHSPDPALLVVREPDLAPLEHQIGRPLHRVGSWEYFNFAAIRIGHLIDRDPERLVRRVIIVSNRPLDESER
jgi:4-amino-4-deoxy-L-arabinose transferase-like glycosyltransferase